MSAEQRHPGPIRILAVDDHPLVRDGISGFVAGQSDMKLVGEASNGREALQQFRAHLPDVTLMDLQMPEMNGVDTIIAIRYSCQMQTTFRKGGRHLSKCVCPFAIVRRQSRMSVPTFTIVV